MPCFAYSILEIINWNTLENINFKVNHLIWTPENEIFPRYAVILILPWHNLSTNNSVFNNDFFVIDCFVTDMFQYNLTALIKIQEIDSRLLVNSIFQGAVIYSIQSYLKFPFIYAYITNSIAA